MTIYGWRVPAILVLAVALLSPVLAAPRAAFACSCAYAPIPNEIRFNDSVFSGKVMEVGEGWTDGYSGAPREVLVAVDHVWLGNVSGQAKVTTASSEASCGYESFVQGERFLIYARATGETFETNLCTPTRRYDAASVKLLESVAGPGVDVEPDATTSDSATNGNSRPWLPVAAWSAGAIAVAALGAAVAIRWRRKA